MSDKPAKPITVAVLANDPVTGEGAVSWFSACTDITAFHWIRRHPADVLLVLATEISGDTLTHVERVRQEGPDRLLPMVMVAHEFPEHHILRAVDLGLVGYLPRQESGFDDIKRAVMEAASGGRGSPSALQQALIGHIKAIRDNVLVPNGLNIAGLDNRETEVLRFLADGLSNKQIAEKLSYSERTVKSIVHSVVIRLNLRNRTHAVVYAVRTGAI